MGRFDTSTLGDIAATEQAKAIKSSDYIYGITKKEAEAWDKVQALLLANPEWTEMQAIKKAGVAWLAFESAKKKAIGTDGGDWRKRHGDPTTFADAIRPNDAIVKNAPKGPIATDTRTDEEKYRAQTALFDAPAPKKLGPKPGFKRKPKAPPPEPVMVSDEIVSIPGDPLIPLPRGTTVKVKPIVHVDNCDCQLCAIKPGDNFGKHPEPTKQEILAKEIAKEIKQVVAPVMPAIEPPQIRKAPRDTEALLAVIDLINNFDEDSRKRIIKGAVAFLGVEL